MPTALELSQTAANAGQAGESITGILGDIFGGSSSTTVKSSGTVIEQLDISEEGVQRVLEELLSSEQGLAAIFSEENISGLYQSSVAAQAAGDLVAQVAGEIAKLKARKITSKSEKSKTSAEKEGLLGTIGGTIGGGVKSIGKALGF